MALKRKLPTVGECIAYIEETGWKLIVRNRAFYMFRNKNAPLHCQELTWSLAEMREAWHNGF